MPAPDSKDEEEDLPTTGLEEPMSDGELVLDSRNICIHEIPRPATPPLQPAPETPPPQPHHGVPASPPQHQVEVPQELELIELDIPDDILDVLDVPKEVMLDFDTWAQDLPSHQG